MHSLTSLIVLLTTAASALRVVPVPFSKAPGTSPSLGRRAASTIPETLGNNVTGGGYFATVQVGTPGQTVTLVLDTGSSDVWVLASNASLCTSERLQEQYGACVTPFDASQSSSDKVAVLDGFTIQYEDNSAAKGSYITDDFTIGSTKVTNLQMGFATDTDINIGVMGIGFDADEAAQTEYPNLIDDLVSQDLIPSKAYSLYLDDLEASTGTILFGGIDTDKYVGDLKAVPIEPDAQSNSYAAFIVTLSSVVGIASNGTSVPFTSNTAYAVVLDSGTTLTYLPELMTEQIFEAFNAYDDSQNSGLVLIDCAYLNSGVILQYQFGGSGGPAINVTMNQIIQNDVQVYYDNGTLPVPPDLPFSSTSICSLNVQAGSEDTYILGDSFLRSAYVVYDLDNKQVALAQSNFNSTSSHVVEISASASVIPLASGVATSASAQQSTSIVPGPIGPHTLTSSDVSPSASASSSAVPVFGSGSITSAGSSSSGTSTASASASSSKSAAAARSPPLALGSLVFGGVIALFGLLGGALLVL